jgi:hypothetical protein
MRREVADSIGRLLFEGKKRIPARMVANAPLIQPHRERKKTLVGQG